MRAMMPRSRYVASLSFTMLVIACSDSTGPAPACTLAHATNTIQLGQTTSGNHVDGDCLQDGWRADGWRFIVTTSTVVVFEVPDVPLHGISVSDMQLDLVVPVVVQNQVAVPLVPGECIIWVPENVYTVGVAYAR